MTTDYPNPEQQPDPTSEAPEAESALSTREQVREKAEQVKARLRRNRIIQLSVVGAVLLAIIITIAIMVTNTVSGAVNKPQVNPAGLSSDGIQITPEGAGLPVSATPGTITDSTASPTPSPTPTPTTSPTEKAAPVDPVEIRIYVDYLSPGSATFQKANAQQLARLISDEAVTVAYHPVATMTSKSNGTRYSLRAAAAAACVASYAPNNFYAYNYELFAQQPDVDSDGMTDSDLADLAIALGAGSADSLRACIDNGTYEPWVKTVTEKATNESLPGTEKTLAEIPTVLVNGTAYIGALDDPAEFMQFIMAAESKAYYDTSTPSPAPSSSTVATPTPAPAG